MIQSEPVPAIQVSEPVLVGPLNHYTLYAVYTYACTI